METKSPFVYWAQNDVKVFIKVDLKDVKEPIINLDRNRLEFFSKSVGAGGLNNYAFVLVFHGELNVKESVHKITDSKVDFTLSKSVKGWWPRLLKDERKPFFLKIDHDRFQSEDLMDENETDLRENYPNLYDELQKEEFGYKKEDFQKVYLTLYNLFMYVGFMYVVCVLSVRYLRDGENSFSGTYAAVGPAVCFLQLLQVLEIMHPIFGYVKGGYLIPLMQVGGRLLIVILMLEFEPRLQTMPVVFYLFMTWSAIEIIRYPYYMSRLFKKENGLLTWLRYTAWMICYPIGFMCEGVIVFRNLIFLEQSDKWSVYISSPFNYTLRFSTLLRIYLLFFIIPCCYTLMSHMYKARKHKIGPKPVKKVKTK